MRATPQFQTGLYLVNDPLADFYNQLAPNYSLIFPDWRKSVIYQSEVLDRLIRGCVDLSSSIPLLLDCSCGIGTQAIGLALKGYKVHGTDISTEAIKRAEAEAAALGATVEFGVADFRHLDVEVQGTFDIVLSCDNSLPHLLSTNDLLLAATSMKAKLKPGGLVLISIRDYDRIIRERPSAEVPRIFDGPEGRRIVFQVWDWEAEGPVYTFSHFILKQVNGEWRTIHNHSRYRALLRDELSTVLREAGFTDIRWHMPEESGYYQPIVTARA